MCYLLSCVQLFVAPWTVAHQAPWSMDSPGKDTRVDYHSPLQEISTTQDNFTEIRADRSAVAKISLWLFDWKSLIMVLILRKNFVFIK